MQGYIRFADGLSAWFGKVFAWCIMIMTLGMNALAIWIRFRLRRRLKI